MASSAALTTPCRHISSKYVSESSEPRSKRDRYCDFSREHIGLCVRKTEKPIAPVEVWRYSLHPHGELSMTSPPDKERKSFVLLLFASVGALLLILTWDLRPFPLAARVDDYRYVLSAHEIKNAVWELFHNGGIVPWLGSYEPTTLFKRPGISIVLAALSALRLPFIHTILLLYLISLAVMADGLLRLNCSRTTVGALFLVCGLMPTLYDSNAVRVIREIATAALETGILGLCIRLFSVSTRTRTALRLFGSPTFIALFVLLGIHWSLREEAVLLLAPTILLVSAVFWLRNDENLKQKAFVICLGIVVLLLPARLAYLGISNLNRVSYGINLVNDVSEGSFPRAVSALKGIEESPCDHSLVSADEARKAMAVSPAFRTIGETVAYAVTQRPDLIYTDGFSGLRLLTQEHPSIGTSAALTQKLFGQIADEIGEACRNRTLRCASRVSGGIVPLLCSSQWRLVPANVAGYLGYVAEVVAVGFDPLWSGNPGIDRLEPAQMANFEEIVQQEMSGRKGMETEFSRPALVKWLQRQDYLRRSIASVYSTLMPYLIVLGGIGLLIRLPFWRDSGRRLDLIILLAVAGHVLCRVVAFSYLSAVDGYLNSRYISVCYPMAAAFAVLAIGETRQLFYRPKPAAGDLRKTPWLRNAGLKWALGTAVLVACGFIYAGARSGVVIAPEFVPDSQHGELAGNAGAEYVQLEGHHVEIVSQNMGFLFPDAGGIKGDFAIFDGWAKDVSTGRPAKSILLFEGNRLLRSVKPSNSIPSLEQGFPQVAHAGFSITLPRWVVKGKSIRIFALLEGNRAGELNYAPSYAYRN